MSEPVENMGCLTIAGDVLTGLGLWNSVSKRLRGAFARGAEPANVRKILTHGLRVNRRVADIVEQTIHEAEPLAPQGWLIEIAGRLFLNDDGVWWLCQKLDVPVEESMEKLQIVRSSSFAAEFWADYWIDRAERLRARLRKG